MTNVINPFRSFFMGGFECSTHCRKDGKRLDLIHATLHDELAFADYNALREIGLLTVRDGLRWHLIEIFPGAYDWSSLRPQLKAAERANVQVIWDLCHYGLPRGLDIWSPSFVERFALFSQEAARIICAETTGPPLFCPINEISFWAWAGGEVAFLNPVARGRGRELKRQLARAAVAATRAIKEIAPSARFISAEPLIHVTGHSAFQREKARKYNLAQYEASDMLTGVVEPDLGGKPEYVDILGLNFYPDNQWVYGGVKIPFGNHDYRPLSDMLVDVHERHGRPIFIAETGAEGSARASWLHYVCGEVRNAIDRGVSVLGICLYPILDYPGWDNDRCCATGLLSMPDEHRHRTLHSSLAEELAHQQKIMLRHAQLLKTTVTRTS
jgi:hypothetical protein